MEERSSGREEEIKKEDRERERETERKKKKNESEKENRQARRVLVLFHERCPRKNYV